MRFPNWASSLALACVLVAVSGCSKQMGTPSANNLATPSTGNTNPSGAATSSSQPVPAPELAKAHTEKPSPVEQIVIPSGTPVTVRLLSAVSSATSNPGDQFDATLDQPLVMDGKTIAPEGARLTGRVVAVRRSGRLEHPGYLRIALASMTIDGRAVPVQSSSIFVAGASHKKRNLAWIGGGAGGGALLGALVGGGKGALIGSAIGAAGGTTTALATGKKDVGFAAERRLTFRITRPVTIA